MSDMIETAGLPEESNTPAEEQTPKKKKEPMTFKRFYKEWILPFGLEILALFLIVKFVLFVPIVPSGSMEPTIAEHSALIALRVHHLESCSGVISSSLPPRPQVWMAPPSSSGSSGCRVTA